MVDQLPSAKARSETPFMVSRFIALFMLAMSDFLLESLASAVQDFSEMNPIEPRMASMVMTTISSTSVNPCCLACFMETEIISKTQAVLRLNDSIVFCFTVSPRLNRDGNSKVLFFIFKEINLDYE